MKICTKCNTQKDFCFFSKRSKSKDGFKSWCKSCDNKHHSLNKENILTNKRSYYVQNKQVYKERCKKWNNKNKDNIIIKDHNWYINNKDKSVAKNAKYRATKLQATPKWLTKDHLKQIESFYKESKELENLDGIKRHVDHIIPLQGKTVSGLHVPWNLQVITRKENIKKGNRITIGLA